MVGTIRTTGINCTSGVYEMRLHFDDNREWEPLGSVAKVQAQAGLIRWTPATSSSLTAQLENVLGAVTADFNDNPNLPYYDQDTDTFLTGSLYREHFEWAREQGFKVHCIIARFSNEVIPVFQEYVFSGSVDPHEIQVGHRLIPKTGRRHETITVQFSPAARLDVKLSVFDPLSGDYPWQQSDMHQPLDPGESDGCLPNWVAVVSEPGLNMFTRGGVPVTDPSTLTGGITAVSVTAERSRMISKTLAYGAHPLSINPDIGIIRDTVGTGPFPEGNWNMLISTAIHKVLEPSHVVWDGVLPPGAVADGGRLDFRDLEFDSTAKINVDQGTIDPDDFIINFNLFFGYSWHDGVPFKSPATYDGDQTNGDVIRGLAALINCKIDKTGDFTAEGLPYIRLVPIGTSEGTFPDLEEIDGASSEDTFVTDSDGVRLSRRGFDGSVLCPANATNPVEIEIPLGFHAIAYETAPAFDVSRITVNSELALKDQWLCGHRSRLTATNEEGDLNPDGWVVGSFLFKYSSSPTVLHFPSNLSSLGLFGENIDADTEAIYHQTEWKGYYPVQAVYEKSAGDLTEEEKRARQINPLISYALAFGKHIRGKRRQLRKRFRGVIAPNWNSIKTGMEYEFTPVNDPVTYAAVEITRFPDEDEIEVLFEEILDTDVVLSYKEEGDNKAGNGSINGQGGNTSANLGDTSLSENHFFNSREVKFYSGGVVQKTLTMTTVEYYDTAEERTVVQQAFAAPYEAGATSEYGFNTLWLPHYKGDEFGNVEIVGVSPEDTPDYWFSGICTFKKGTDGAAYYDPELVMWSEDENDWIIKRGLEKTHVSRRIYIHGRIKAYYDTGAGLLMPDWVTLTGGEAIPMSNEEIWTESDLYNGTTGNPTLTGTGGAIILSFGPRLKPVALSASAALYKEPGSALTYFTEFVGAMPVYNQLPLANDATIQFWHFDPATGHYTPNGQVSPPLLVDPIIGAGDWLYVDVWGLVEVIGENATLA
jgi:hypothetical protein